MNYSKIFKIIAVASLLIISSANHLLSAAPKKFNTPSSHPKTSVVLKGLGTLYLEKNKSNQNDITQLVLKKSGNITILADTYEGLDPVELMQCDFDKDELPEVIVVVKYPNSPDVIPYVYTFNEGIEKVFPNPEKETELLNCRAAFLTFCNSKPALGLQFLVAFHDYAPPELYRLEMYTIDKSGFNLAQIGYNEGTHYNLLMNLAAEKMHLGRTKEAALLYEQAVASSSGDISQKAFVEALFCEAEALKFSGSYQNAMKLYEKIVLEFTDSNFTETAQKELEFLAANKKSNKLLNEFFKIQQEIINNNELVALDKLEQLINKNPNCNFMDRLLFTKAELLISNNRIDEALEIYTSIKVKFPNSSIIDEVEEMLEDLEARPEDTDGL